MDPLNELMASANTIVHLYYTNQKGSISMSHMLDVYNELTGEDIKLSKCISCMYRVIEKLKQYLDGRQA